MGSATLGAPESDAELPKPNWFNVPRFPRATFQPGAVKKLNPGKYEVAGNLTLLGKTLPVTLKANQFNCYTSPMLKREVCGGDFETTIDRTAFGMNYGVDWGFQKNVRLVIQVEAVKQ